MLTTAMRFPASSARTPDWPASSADRIETQRTLRILLMILAPPNLMSLLLRVPAAGRTLGVIVIQPGQHVLGNVGGLRAEQHGIAVESLGHLRHRLGFERRQVSLFAGVRQGPAGRRI